MENTNPRDGINKSCEERESRKNDVNQGMANIIFID
jgi:hypothetical protein